MYKPLVLIVDDDPYACEALARRLKSRYEPVVAMSGGEALAQLAAGAQPVAIVCDLVMPGMMGHDLYAEVGAHFPQLLSRFVFMSASRPSSLQVFLDSIPNRCLDKPFAMEDLEATIRVVGWSA